jgi:hypothetical protein
VNISFNHIETFMFDLPVWYDASPETTDVPATLDLTMEGNPLLCDCFAAELKQELGSSRRVSLRNPRSITCGSSSPPQLVNASLVDVRFEVGKYLLHTCVTRQQNPEGAASFLLLYSSLASFLSLDQRRR